MKPHRMKIWMRLLRLIEFLMLFDRFETERTSTFVVTVFQLRKENKITMLIPPRVTRVTVL